MNSIIRLEHVAESCSGCHDRSHERRPTRRRPSGLSSRAAAGGPGAVEAGDVEVHVAQPAAVDPDVAGLAARRAGPHPGHGGEAVLRVQLAAHGPRQPRAPRVHGEPARRAPVEEGAGGDVLAADVAVRPRLAVVATAAPFTRLRLRSLRRPPFPHPPLKVVALLRAGRVWMPPVVFPTTLPSTPASSTASCPVFDHLAKGTWTSPPLVVCLVS